ncbi:MAG: pyridoxine 5'-phosphate synthase [Elusimicrobia bacterium RIFOXYA2_FULL_58_8]|nr:MAG: pyridoxine 5'-phosphate synthase [Elusimicrobia bacterium RIFOXYA2_FULL_58_8]OGS13100.1 MAG: pyridoxine 5'-phosphate synthase [Elusimicrobia bacterium RIFOXYA12_FULL_57_11]
MKHVKLGVNIDHVATLRQARKEKNPDTVEAARVVYSSGGDMVVMHLRQDRRHIQEADLERVRREVKGILHLEIAAIPEMEKLALLIHPDSVCLVPESAREVTTQGGLKLNGRNKELEKTIKNLSGAGIEVGVFCDPEPQVIRTAHNMGADSIELCTSSYSGAWGKKLQARELEKLQLAGFLVKELKLQLHAGHGLDYYNVAPVARIEGMDCLNIGFSIISRAMFVGLKTAVSEMKRLIQ